MEALSGLHPVAVMLLAGIAAVVGWPVAQQYWPMILAVFSRALSPQPRESLPDVPAKYEDQRQNTAVAPPADQSTGVLTVYALEQVLKSQGVSADERAKLIDPLWPAVARSRKGE